MAGLTNPTQPLVVERFVAQREFMQRNVTVSDHEQVNESDSVIDKALKRAFNIALTISPPISTKEYHKLVDEIYCDTWTHDYF